MTTIDKTAYEKITKLLKETELMPSDRIDMYKLAEGFTDPITSVHYVYTTDGQYLPESDADPEKIITDDRDVVDLRQVKGPVDIRGGAGDDYIYGSLNAPNFLYGDGKWAFFEPNDGTDAGLQNPGDDRIYGGNVFNIIYGGKGSDDLYSGTGYNVYEFKSGDGRAYIHTQKGGKEYLYFYDFTEEQMEFGVFGNDLGIRCTKGNDVVEVYVEGFFSNGTVRKVFCGTNALDSVTAIIEQAKQDGTVGTQVMYNKIIKEIDSLAGLDVVPSTETLTPVDKKYTIESPGRYIINNSRNTIGDEIIFPDGLIDDLTDLEFIKIGNDMCIQYSDENLGNNYTVILKNYFTLNETTALNLINGMGIQESDVFVNVTYENNPGNALAGTFLKDNIDASTAPKGLTVNGYNSNDTIVGSDFNDVINGGNGNDTITGGRGNDAITGGAGTNVIVYTKTNFDRDTVTLTNKENLVIDVTDYGFADLTKLKENSTIKVVGKNVEITLFENKGEPEEREYGTIVLNNYGATNVVGADGTVQFLLKKATEEPVVPAVTVNLNPTTADDIANGYLFEYSQDSQGGDFTVRGTTATFTGSRFAEKITSTNSGKATTINAGLGYNEITLTDNTISTQIDTVNGGNDGNNIIITKSGNKNVTTGTGDDTVKITGNGVHTVRVSNGTNDVTIDGEGNNTVVGGTGSDTVTIKNGNGVQNVNVAAGTNTVNIKANGNTTVTGGVGDDTITVLRRDGVGHENDTGITTINASNGENEVTVTRNGNTTVTGGVHGDTVKITGNGVHTVRVSNGINDVTIDGEGNNTVVGGTGADTVIITNGNGVQNVNVAAGINTVNIKANGNVTVTGGVDADEITVLKRDGENDDTGITTINASNGDNTVTVTRNGNVTVTGGVKKDTVTITGEGKHTVNAGADTNFVTINGKGDNSVSAAAGNDSVVITNADGNQIVNVGTADNETGNSVNISFSAGKGGVTTVSGGVGKDDFTVTGNSKKTTLNLSNGDNKATVTGSGDVAITGGTSVDTVFVDSIGKGVINTNAGNDDITVNNGTNTINAGAGDDEITVNGGVNTITSGAGKDTFIFNSVNGVNTLSDADNNDIIKIPNKTLGQLQFIKNGNNLEIRCDDDNKIILTNYFAKKAETRVDKLYTLDHSSEENVVHISAQSVTITGQGTIIGTDNPDNIVGSDVVDTIKGGKGDDTIYAKNGNDKIYGEAGNDTMIFNTGDGSDIVYSGAIGETDILVFNKDKTNTGILEFGRNMTGGLVIAHGNGDTVTLDSYKTKLTNHSVKKIGVYVYNEDSVNDDKYDYVEKNLSEYVGTTLNDYSALDILGTANNDVLTADATGSTLYGFDGNDTLRGGNGKDFLYGGNGNDTIAGGNDDDYIEGGAGNDTITGGLGNNKVVYAKTDFGTDTINLTAKENLIIDLSAYGYTSLADFKNNAEVKVNGKNVEITLPKDEVSNYGTIKLTNFAASNVVGVHGSVLVDLGLGAGNEVNLNTADLFAYDNDDFKTSGNSKIFTGSRFGETITAENIGAAVSINGGDGYNTIIVSEIDGENPDTTAYNDVISGGKDGNHIEITKYGQKTVTTGAGDDYVEINGDGTHTVRAGDGDNYVEISGDGVANVTTGKGNDDIVISNTTKNVTVNVGNTTNIDAETPGYNDIYLQNTTGTNTITGGTGDDFLTLDNSGTTTAKLFDGNNSVDIYGSGTTTIISGKDDDTININAEDEAVTRTVTIKAGKSSADGYNLIDIDNSTGYFGNIVLNEEKVKATNVINFTNNIDNNYTVTKKGNAIIISNADSSIQIDEYNNQGTGNFANIQFTINDVETDFNSIVAATGKSITISGNGVIDGTDASDRIEGGKGNDTITGKKGDDTINAGAGVNTLKFAAGDENDTVENGGGTDTLVFAAGTNIEDITNYADDQDRDVVLKYGETDTVKLQNFKDGGHSVKYVQIGNVKSSVEDYLAVKYGTDGNDTFNSTENDETFELGGGDDTVIFGAKYGNDNIFSKNNPDVKNTDTLQFKNNSLLAKNLDFDYYSDTDINIYTNGENASSAIYHNFISGVDTPNLKIKDQYATYNVTTHNNPTGDINWTTEKTNHVAFIQDSEGTNKVISNAGFYNVINTSGGAGLDYEYKGGYDKVAAKSSSSNDIYRVSTFNANTALDIEDANGDDSIYINEDVSKMRLYFNVNADGNINSDISVVHNGVMNLTTVNKLISDTGWVKGVVTLRGAIETFATKDHVKGLEGNGYNKWCNHVKSKVQNWLNDPANKNTKTQELFTDAQDVFLNGTAAQKNALLALYNVTYMEAKYGGTNEVDIISDDEGYNKLSGLGANDELYGQDGDDTITGGTGDDKLDGGTGKNKFVFSVGDGEDTIRNNGVNADDTIEFVKGVTSLNDLNIYEGENDNNLYIEYGAEGNKDKIILENYKDGHSTKHIKIANKTYDISDQLTNKYGTDGDDTFNSSAADDNFYLKKGNDTVTFGQNWGYDIVYTDSNIDGEGKPTNTDTLKFTNYSLSERNLHFISDDDLETGERELIIYKTNSEGVVHYKNFFSPTSPNLTIVDKTATYSVDKYTGNTAISLEWTAGEQAAKNHVVFISGRGNKTVVSNAKANVITTYGTDIGTLNYTYTGGTDTVYSGISDAGANDTYNVDSFTTATKLDITDLGGNDTVNINSASANLRLIFDVSKNEQTGEYEANTDQTIIANANNTIFNITNFKAQFTNSSDLPTPAGMIAINGIENYNTTDHTAELSGMDVDTWKNRIADKVAEILEDTIYNSVEEVMRSSDTATQNKVFACYNQTYDNVIYTGSDEADTIYGGTGNDTINGNGGDDTIYGGSGNDTIIGGKDNDTLNGGSGNNIFKFAEGDGKDIVENGEGNDTLAFDEGVDVRFSKDENGDLVVEYGDGDDTVTLKGSASGEHSVKTIKIGNTEYVTENLARGEEITAEASTNLILSIDKPFGANSNHTYQISNVAAGTKFEYLENGRLLITGNNLNIDANKGQVDDLIICGAENTIYTFDGDDLVRIGGAFDSEAIGTGIRSNSNKVYSGDGDDFVYVADVSNSIDGGAGDNYALSVGSNTTATNIELRQYDKNETTPPDGIIGRFNQGTSGGDCRLLALIRSLSNGLTGNESYSDYVTITQTDTNYTATFNKYIHQGKQNSVTFAIEELTGFKNVYGDLDIVVTDYALNMLLAINLDRFQRSVQNAYYNTLSDYFFGTEDTTFVAYDPEHDTDDPSEGYISSDTYKQKINELWEMYNNHEISNITLGISGDSDEELGIIGGHAYAVKDVLEDYISLTNVWNSADVLNLDYDKFLTLTSGVIVYGKDIYDEHEIESNGDDELYGTEGDDVFCKAGTEGDPKPIEENDKPAPDSEKDYKTHVIGNGGDDVIYLNNDTEKAGAVIEYYWADGDELKHNGDDVVYDSSSHDSLYINLGSADVALSFTDGGQNNTNLIIGFSDGQHEGSITLAGWNGQDPSTRIQNVIIHSDIERDNNIGTKESPRTIEIGDNTCTLKNIIDNFNPPDIVGTDGDDTLIATSSTTSITGKKGNDKLYLYENGQNITVKYDYTNADINDGKDIVYDAKTGKDSLFLMLSGKGYELMSIRCYKSGNDLIIKTYDGDHRGTHDLSNLDETGSITLSNYYSAENPNLGITINDRNEIWVDGWSAQTPHSINALITACGGIIPIQADSEYTVTEGEFGQEISLTEGNNTVIFGSNLGYETVITSENTSGNGYTDTFQLSEYDLTQNNLNFDIPYRNNELTSDLWIDAVLEQNQGTDYDGDVIYTDFFTANAGNLVIQDKNRSYNVKACTSGNVVLDNNANTIALINSETATQITSNGNYNIVKSFDDNGVEYNFNSGHDIVVTNSTDSDDIYNISTFGSTSALFIKDEGGNDTLDFNSSAGNFRMVFNYEYDPNNSNPLAGIDRSTMFVDYNSFNEDTFSKLANNILTDGVIHVQASIENEGVFGIETVKTTDYQNGIDTQTWANAIIENIVGWMSDNPGYGSVQQALNDSDADIQGLMNCYVSYEDALTQMQG